MATTSSLETEAMKRKERLMMLKRKAAATEEGGPNLEKADENTTEDQPKRPAFRSYNPADESLKKDAEVVPPAEPIDLDEHVQDQIESAEKTAIANEIDLATLAPRKIDWDLKRDAEKKLRKLERRTQWAIAELIRERLASGKEDLLLSAVNSGAQAEEDRHSSDDED